MNKFWIVWNPQGHNPQCRHENWINAKAEAERLASKCPGQEFFVFEAVGHAKKVDVAWTDIRFNLDQEEIPF